MAEVNAEKEGGDLEQEIEEEMNEQDKPVVKKDYYFKEAMNVTLDYINLAKLAGANQVGGGPRIGAAN